MEEPIQIPQEYLCPISTQLMKDPVIAGDGITYQRKFIQQWMKRSNDSPFTGKRLPHKTVTINYALKNTIENFTNKMPIIMRQNQIRIDLEYALKIKEEEVKTFMNKIEQKNAKSQKDEEKFILIIKQLEKELMIERASHQKTQNINVELQDKCMALEIHLQELNYELQQARKKQCTCMKKYDKIEKTKMDIFNYIPKQQIPKIDFKDQFLNKYPLNIQQLFKGAKRISITPNQKLSDFKEGDVKLEQKNSNICTTFKQNTADIFSNQQLPMKNQSFYFIIKALKLFHFNHISIGISFSNYLMNLGRTQNSIRYSLSNKSLHLFNTQITKNPVSSINYIKQFPSQLILLVSKPNKNIFIIYNNEVQVKIPLTYQMTNSKYKCYAYALLGFDSKIQFM